MKDFRVDEDFLKYTYKMLFCLLLWGAKRLVMIDKQDLKNVHHFVNPSTPMSDQDRTCPHNIHTISSRQVMRIKRNINYGISS